MENEGFTNLLSTLAPRYSLPSRKYMSETVLPQIMAGVTACVKLEITNVQWFSSPDIVGHFKHSPLAYCRLKEIQQSLGIPQHHLKQDEPVRWNSTLHMLQSVLKQKMALVAMVLNMPSHI